MKLQGGETVKLNDILYISYSVKNKPSVPRLAEKGDTIGATKENINIEKNVVIMNLKSRKVKTIAKCSTLRLIYSPRKAFHLKRQTEIFQQKNNFNTTSTRKKIDARRWSYRNNWPLMWPIDTHISEKKSHLTYDALGIKLTGKLEVCDGCEKSKTKERAVRKKTYTRDKNPVERVFVDTTGPFPQF